MHVLHKLKNISKCFGSLFKGISYLYAWLICLMTQICILILSVYYMLGVMAS